MTIGTIITGSVHIVLSSRERKTRDDPAFSQRMLENHLSQEHDWASRRRAVIEQQVAWIAGQLPAGARILDLGCGPGLHPPAGRARLLLYGCGFFTGVDRLGPPAGSGAGLDIAYHQQDVRDYAPETPFDFIMMTFAELNVFSAAEARSLVNRCAQWLVPVGKAAHRGSYLCRS